MLNEYNIIKKDYFDFFIIEKLIIYLGWLTNKDFTLNFYLNNNYLKNRKIIK